jgi:hypothetical protein
MRFITDCRDCGPVVLRAEAVALVHSEGEAPSQAVFDCPICLRVETMALTRPASVALVACGLPVVGADHDDPEAPLTLLHLSQLQDLLSDDDAWREVLGGAS